MTVWKLCRFTLAENLARNMFLLNFVFIGGLIFLHSFVLSSREAEYQPDLFTDGAFSLISLFCLFFSLTCTFPQIPQDIQSNRLPIFLACYLSRAQYLLGRYAGSVLSVWLNVILMHCVLILWLFLAFGSAPAYLGAHFFAICCESAFLCVLALGFSLFFSRFLGLAGFFIVYLMGHFTYYLNYYLQAEGNELLLGKVLKHMYLCLPNFEVYAIKNALFTSSLPEGYLLELGFYTLLWVFLILWIAILLFEKKEI